jgi:diacylglycerol kinase (ATP)
MRLSSFKYAINGLRLLLITQANARFHSVFALITIVAGIYFNCSIIEWCLIVLSIGTVLTAEAMNTSLEFLTNLVSPDYHTLAGKAKDVAAGAVLISAISALIVGLLIFVPKLLLL